MSFSLRSSFGALILFLATATAGAADGAIERLAHDPQWLRLLHVGDDGRTSEIHSPEFFLSPEGATNPEAELRATLQALQSPVPASDADGHARCRFPARAWWLQQQGALPALALPHEACARLAAWGRFDRLRSVSLLLVSGYFGNPASSFGHSLLRLNTEDGRGSDGLIDLGVNFGALVPDGESTPVYVIKGLSGGYQAGFSDKPYYAHDLMYSRTEFRDMWDHELALDDAERLFLVYHLWEIVGKKFTYYFLKENCAYRMAELLALVRGQDLLQRSTVWFAPVEMFHRLHDAQQRSGRPWFRAVRFIPSAERVLRHEFEALEVPQARAANAAIAQGGAPWQELPAEQQIGVLDTLLAYYNYRAAAEEPTVDPATQQAKDGIVRARVQLPPRRAASLDIPMLRSPAEGTAPMLGAAGVGHDDRRGDFVRLRWAPFSYELTGHNGLPDGELVVLDTVVDVGRHGGVLQTLDVMRIKKLNAHATRIHGESALSWQLQLGAQREWIGDGARLRARASIGAGAAVRLDDTLTAVAMADAVALGNPSSLGTEPQLGLLWRADAWRLWMKAGTRYESATRHWAPRQQADLTRRLSADSALRLELEHQQALRAALSFVRYW
ncbi:MAG TPA: DUF4105 domain-containing protein [Albitalea sp.]|uniref:Lnb N-terminal periplasmic domain-containing protein n=1 Tax=Piscinibacter sp. TaxID=1903157 RepID=UPI002ED34F22